LTNLNHCPKFGVHYIDNFNRIDGSISFDGQNYQVDFFVHFHFIGIDASPDDKSGFDFFNYFHIVPAIYYNGNYFYYDSTGTKSIIYP